MKAKSLLVGIAAILLISIFNSNVLGEPMFSPTPQETQEAAEKTEWIVITEFVNYWPQRRFEFGYLEYKILQVLKGKPLNDLIRIRYDLNDWPSCVPVDERFSDTFRPKKASKWILFLVGKTDDAKVDIIETELGDNGLFPEEVYEEQTFKESNKREEA